MRSYRKPISFRHIVTSAEETATEVVLSVANDSKEYGYVYEVKRAGAKIETFTATFDSATGNLTIANGTGTLTAGDEVVVIGTLF